MAPAHKTKHFVTMDGLRGVAAIVVVIYHSLWMWPGATASWHGHLAVDFFFVLSGFVIAHAYGDRLASGQMHFKGFIVARAVRLYPMIILGAAFGSAVAIDNGLARHSIHLIALVCAGFPLAAVALPQPFYGNGPFFPNVPAWSLFFELIANVFYVAFIPRLSTRWVALIATASGVSLAVTIYHFGKVDVGPKWSNMAAGLPRVAFPFVTGILLQRLHFAERLRVASVPIWILAPLLVLILRVPIFSSPKIEVVFTLAAVFLMFPVMVASASHDEPSEVWSKIAKLSANISFPIYLLHSPIIDACKHIPIFMSSTPLVRLIFILSISIAGAVLADLLYDAPVRRWLTKKARDRSFFGNETHFLAR